MRGVVEKEGSKKLMRTGGATLFVWGVFHGGFMGSVGGIYTDGLFILVSGQESLFQDICCEERRVYMVMECRLGPWFHGSLAIGSNDR